jgi:SpoVK/Ycf46/Vps4 family AAA+-type ATPase
LDAVQGTVPAEVLEHFSGADPEPHDEGHRARVSALLTEAGLDEAAARWRHEPPAQDSPLAGAGGAAVIRLFRAEGDQEADAGLRQTARPTITFADVAGMDQVKQQVRRKIIAPFEKPDLFQAFRKRSGGGVLMYGPPGCGKTMLARATAGEAKAHFIPIAITDVLDKFFGESERKLATAFARARSHRPSILFFDELEALAARRRSSGEIGASLVSTFLSEMDGFAADGDGVLVIGATNTPWAIDSAFRRPGRFDRVLFVPPPDQAARLAILSLSLSGRPLAPGLNLQRFAEATSGFSGADIANLVDTAVELAIEDSSEVASLTPVSRRHLEAALKDVRPTTSEWLATARNYAKFANEGGLYDDLLAFIDRHVK